MARILYCHCAYARVVPVETKTAVLEGLTRAGVEFDAVPDLCEMAASQDPRLAELAAKGPLRVAACYPRAVKWLFASAGVNIDGQGTVIHNMRICSAGDVLKGVLDGERSHGPAEAGHYDRGERAEHSHGPAEAHGQGPADRLRQGDGESRRSGFAAEAEAGHDDRQEPNS